MSVNLKEELTVIGAPGSEEHFSFSAPWPQLCATPRSFRLFVSLMLCVVSLSYLALLSGIAFDTEMKVGLIIEAYQTFDTIELIEHTIKYLPLYIGVFGVTLFLFMFTSYPEKMKRMFACLVPMAIVSDVASMWLIRYNTFFGWQLFVSGLVLAFSFLTLFLLIQRDLWIRRDL
jgi:hypothetical protein